MKPELEIFFHHSAETNKEIMYFDGFCDAITERDTEWEQKIQTALAETSNLYDALFWNCKEVLTKLLED